MRSTDLLFLASAVTLVCVPARPQQACNLLTAAQVSAAAGGPMQQPGGPVSAIGCAWGGSSSGGARRSASLSIRPSAEYDHAKASLGSLIVPVSDLGDGAFFFPTKHNNVILYVLKGTHFYVLSVSVSTNTLQQNEAAEKTLATQMLLNL